MFRKSASLVFTLAVTTLAFGQQVKQVQQQARAGATQSAPPWVVSVVHAIESNKMAARLRQQENVRVALSAAAPQTLLNISTGLVIDDKGHVVSRLANLDPKDKSDIIIVALSDGTQHKARLIGIDCPTGFAVLEVPALKITPPAFAATNVLSNGMAVRILSADARTKTTDGANSVSIDYAIKRDVGQISTGSMYSRARGALTLNSGNLLSRNDGSIVTTLDNQVAGMAQYAGFGRAYLFPSELIRDTVAKRVIEKQDSVQSGWLGVRVEGLTRISEPEFTSLGVVRRSGVIVREVLPDSPATGGGIQPNDVIIGLDDIDIGTRADLSAVLSSSPAGRKVRVRAIRNRAPLEIELILAPGSYNGPMISFAESEALAETDSAQRDRLMRRVDEIRTQFREYSKTATQKQIEEAIRELRVEVSQLYDQIRAIDLRREAERESLVADNKSTEQDHRVFVFSVGFAARDLDQTMEPQLAGFFGANRGVLVVRVVKGSAAEVAGIRAGDVIVGAQRRVDLTCTMLDTILVSNKGQIPLRIVREKKAHLLSLNPAGK
jgi:S1-C subfamily serine protease